MKLEDAPREYLEGMLRYIVYNQPNHEAEFYIPFLAQMNKNIEVHMTRVDDTTINFKGVIK